MGIAVFLYLGSSVRLPRPVYPVSRGSAFPVQAGLGVGAAGLPPWVLPREDLPLRSRTGCGDRLVHHCAVECRACVGTVAQTMRAVIPHRALPLAPQRMLCRVGCAGGVLYTMLACTHVPHMHETSGTAEAIVSRVP